MKNTSTAQLSNRTTLDKIQSIVRALQQVHSCELVQARLRKHLWLSHKICLLLFHNKNHKDIQQLRHIAEKNKVTLRAESSSSTQDKTAHQLRFWMGMKRINQENYFFRLSKMSWTAQTRIKIRFWLKLCPSCVPSSQNITIHPKSAFSKNSMNTKVLMIAAL